MNKTTHKPWRHVVADSAAAAEAWWNALQLDNGARAVLRRAQSPTDAILAPAGTRLAAGLLKVGIRDTDENLQRIGVVAMLLAQVRHNAAPAATPRTSHLAKALGADVGGGPLMKQPRWERLIRAQSPEEILIAFRGAIALLGGQAPIQEITAAVLDWSDDRRIVWTFSHAGSDLAEAA